MPFDVEKAYAQILEKYPDAPATPATTATRQGNSLPWASPDTTAARSGAKQDEGGQASQRGMTVKEAVEAMVLKRRQRENVVEFQSLATATPATTATKDWKPDTKSTPEDAELYADALRLHGPMSYGKAMRVLGWGGTRAGQAEDALRQAGRISFNNLGWAVLKDGGSDGGS